jgi:hypothetical protein
MEELYKPLTMLTARIFPGQKERFDETIKKIHANQRPSVPGTAARYITCDIKDPDEVQIILMWRNAVMPVEEDRKNLVGLLQAEFTGILDWKATFE